jgi:hypothetical protein
MYFLPKNSERSTDVAKGCGVFNRAKATGGKK